jgi:hypothetical protein
LDIPGTEPLKLGHYRCGQVRVFLSIGANEKNLLDKCESHLSFLEAWAAIEDDLQDCYRQPDASHRQSAIDHPVDEDWQAVAKARSTFVVETIQQRKLYVFSLGFQEVTTRPVA